VFTSRLEEILLSWQLSLKDKEEETTVFLDLNGEWKSSSEDISFAGSSITMTLKFISEYFFTLKNISGHPFILTHHWIEESTETEKRNELVVEKKGCQVFASLMDKRHDFPVKCHSLAKFYGLSDFVVMAPAGNEMLTSENRINLLLSSVTIAVNNVQRYLEFFVLFVF